MVLSKRTKTLVLTPKSTAEWLFIPTVQQYAKSKVSHKDVGLVIEHGEVLVLNPDELFLTEDERLKINCKEGTVVIVDKEWMPWKKSISSAQSIFDIARIIREFEEE